MLSSTKIAKIKVCFMVYISLFAKIKGRENKGIYSSYFTPPKVCIYILVLVLIRGEREGGRRGGGKEVRGEG